MTRLRLAGLVAGLALVLTGCGIKAGSIVGKEYVPAYDYSCQVGSVPVGNNVTVPIWGQCHSPEAFVLYLIDGDKDGSVYVTESEYDSAVAGEWYPKGGR